MTARDTVLNTTELLDHVVGHLDWKTALAAQRVSHLWHDVICTGTSIQYKLGLKRIDKKKQWALGWNALGMFASARRVRTDETTSNLQNELLISSGHATDVFARFAKLTVGRLFVEDYGNEYIFKVDAIPKALFKHDGNASWHDMQITQPPTTTINISTIRYYRDSLMYRRIPGHQAVTRVHCEQGITLGQVMEIVKQWTNDSPLGTDWSNERFALTTVHVIDDDGFLHQLSHASSACCG